VRFNHDGSLDRTFGRGGHAAPAVHGLATAVAVSGHHGVLVGGSTGGGDFRLARFSR
jgi:hypothetical protein